MKLLLNKGLGLCLLCFLSITLTAQSDKKISTAFGAGYYLPISNYEGVMYDNAQFDPQTSGGISYFLSVDYALNEKFKLGLGLNGAYASADFINNAIVNDFQVPGFLEGGAYSGMRLLVNATYFYSSEKIQPYGKLGIGYFVEQAELGDVPLELTDNVETEIFTDFKYSGLGVIPEFGLSYKDFAVSAAYSMAFGEMLGEVVQEGYQSPGQMNLSGIQLNLTYRIDLF